jgi:hypothetical protein
VVEALRKAQVEVLLVSDRLADEEVLVGPGPLDLALAEAALTAAGADEVHRAPADRALLRAAAGSGAEVVLLPPAALPDDTPVAALLRYSDAATPGQG